MRIRSARAAVYVVVLLTGAASGIAQTSTGASGHWEGSIDVPGQPLDIAVDLKPKSAGEWDGTITIPAQKIKGFPLSAITVQGTAVSFAMKGVPGDPQFKGTLSPDSAVLSGDFMQGGMNMTFKLSRKGDAKFEPPARSALVSKELEGTWEGSLDVEGKPLRLVLKLANQGGAASATLVSVDQGNAEVPIGSVTETGGKLTLALPAIDASYEGALKGGEIVGTWTQGPGSLPLTFKRK